MAIRRKLAASFISRNTIFIVGSLLTSDQPPNNHKTIQFVLIAIMAVSVFLPWVSVGASGSLGGFGGSVSESANGLKAYTNSSMLVLLCVVLTSILLYKNMSISFLGAVLILIIGLSALLFNNVGGEMSYSGGGYEVHVRKGFGLYLLNISSLISVFLDRQNIKALIEQIKK